MKLKSKQARVKRVNGWRLLSIILLCLLWIAILFRRPLLQQFHVYKREAIRQALIWGSQHGFDAEGFSQTEKVLPRFAKALLRAPKLWWQADRLDLPTLQFDLSFRNYQHLSRFRNAAMHSGGILHRYKVPVPAKLQLRNAQAIRLQQQQAGSLDCHAVTGNELQADNVTCHCKQLSYYPINYKTNIRLKGDAVDHVNTRKWSLRVNIRKSKALFGMRRFSVQNPTTRDFLGELLMAKTVHLINANVMTPRFYFVNVIVNSHHWGVMNLEEHFAKELLEQNHRPDSVILKFSDSYYMNYWVFERSHANPVYTSFYTSPIEAIGMQRIKRSPVLRNDYRVSVGLLRGFIQGKLPAHRVFDTQQMAAYLAAIDLWGASHGLIYINLRFYYNPITAKLEPIISDVELNQHYLYMLPSRMSYKFRLSVSRKILQDPVMLAAYRHDIRRYMQMVRSGYLQQQIMQLEQRYTRLLGEDFYLLEPINQHFFLRQLECFTGEKICRTDALIAYYIHNKSDLLYALSKALQQRLMNLYEIGNNSQHYLQLQNMVPFDLKVLSIHYEDASGNRHPIAFQAPVHFPLILAKNKLRSRPVLYQYAYVPNQRMGYHIVAVAEPVIPEPYQDTFKQVKPMSVVAKTYVPVLQQPILPVADLTTMLHKNPFIKQQLHVLTIAAGNWHVTGNLVIPPAYRLIIAPGTTLHFARHALLLSYGATYFGTPGKQPPVLLQGDNWAGIVLLNAHARSYWNHVVVQATQGIQTADWSLRGGVNMYQSAIHMNHCQFIANQAEDALNIVRSPFSLYNLHVSHTQSDGVDIDFAKGVIDNGKFDNIGHNNGGDGLDVSGSSVRASHLFINRAADKGISIGEQSLFRGDHIVIVNAKVAIVSKDASIAWIKQLWLRDIKQYALMTYVKKFAFGLPSMCVQDIHSQPLALRAVAETGSYLSIDHRQQPSSAANDQRIHDYQRSLK